MSDLLHATELGLNMLEQAMNIEPYNPHKTRPVDEPEPSAQVARDAAEIFGGWE